MVVVVVVVEVVCDGSRGRLVEGSIDSSIVLVWAHKAVMEAIALARSEKVNEVVVYGWVDFGLMSYQHFLFRYLTTANPPATLS